MKKRTLGVAVTLAVVAALSLGLASSAPATPTFGAVTPTTATNGPGSSFTLTIFGSGFDAIATVANVSLQMTTPPFDTIDASDPQVHLGPGGDDMTCNVSTSSKTPGAYNVEIDYYSLSGETIPETGVIPSAFTVTAVAPTPSSPYITSVSPAKAIAGGPAFTLTVNGSDFATGDLPAVVNWNGVALGAGAGPPLSPTAVLYALVPANLIATPGAALITVTNPDLGGDVTSNAIDFTIANTAPVLTGLAPQMTWAKLVTPPAVLLNGSGFVAGATAVVNGVARAATFVSATQLSVQLTAADIASAGSVTIAASDPAPGGGVSAALPFTVDAETTAPVTTISGADTAWHNTPVTLTVTATDGIPSQSGVQKTMCGIGATPPWTQLSGTSLTVPGPMGGDPNGSNVVSAYSIDNCDSAEAPAVTATVNICTTGPTTEAFAPSSVAKGKTLKLGYRADSITPTCTITLKITRSNGDPARTINVGQKASRARGVYSFTGKLARGRYKVKVYSTDAAGNAQSAMTGDSFTVK